MRINNNLMALNAHRQLKMNNSGKSKSLERLSSGLRVSRAGDDAAGLAISEKMRAQIKGLNQASRNAQDGISLIQTAEGALNETQNILKRMRTLSIQAANDTNIDKDREAIQNEIRELTKEVDRIASSTEFNTQKLLEGDGSISLKATNISTSELGKLSGGTDPSTIEAEVQTTVGNVDGNTATYIFGGKNIKVDITNVIAGMDPQEGDYKIIGDTIKIGVIAAPATSTTDVADATKAAMINYINSNDNLKGNFIVDGVGSSVNIRASKEGAYAGEKGTVDAVSLVGFTRTAIVSGVDVPGIKASRILDLSNLYDGSSSIDSLEKLEGRGLTINGKTIEFYDADKASYKGDAIPVNISSVKTAIDAATFGNLLGKAISEQVSIEDINISLEATGIKVEASIGGLDGNEIKVMDGGVLKDYEIILQIGANEGQNMKFGISDMRANALGIIGADISTTDGASKAITTFDDALNKVSEQRAKLGAAQNRLEHTIKNLDVGSENLQASESRIRDVDMAKEMMEFTKSNILTQASQAMLAQANQAPQGVLQLLK